MEPLAVSIADAAKVLGLGRTSIYAMIADGRWRPSGSGGDGW